MWPSTVSRTGYGQRQPEFTPAGTTGIPIQNGCSVCNINHFVSPQAADAHFKSFRHCEEYLMKELSLGFTQFTSMYQSVPFGLKLDYGGDLPENQFDPYDRLDLHLYRTFLVKKGFCSLCNLTISNGLQGWRVHVKGVCHAENYVRTLEQLGSVSTYREKFGCLTDPPPNMIETAKAAHQQQKQLYNATANYGYSGITAAQSNYYSQTMPPAVSAAVPQVNYFNSQPQQSTFPQQGSNQSYQLTSQGYNNPSQGYQQVQPTAYSVPGSTYVNQSGNSYPDLTPKFNAYEPKTEIKPTPKERFDAYDILDSFKADTYASKSSSVRPDPYAQKESLKDPYDKRDSYSSKDSFRKDEYDRYSSRDSYKEKNDYSSRDDFRQKDSYRQKDTYDSKDSKDGYFQKSPYSGKESLHSKDVDREKYGQRSDRDSHREKDSRDLYGRGTPKRDTFDRDKGAYSSKDSYSQSKEPYRSKDSHGQRDTHREESYDRVSQKSHDSHHGKNYDSKSYGASKSYDKYPSKSSGHEKDSYSNKSRDTYHKNADYNKDYKGYSSSSYDTASKGGNSDVYQSSTKISASDKEREELLRIRIERENLQKVLDEQKEAIARQRLMLQLDEERRRQLEIEESRRKYDEEQRLEQEREQARILAMQLEDEKKEIEKQKRLQEQLELERLQIEKEKRDLEESKRQARLLEEARHVEDRLKSLQKKYEESPDNKPFFDFNTMLDRMHIQKNNFEKQQHVLKSAPPHKQREETTRLDSLYSQLRVLSEDLAAEIKKIERALNDVTEIQTGDTEMAGIADEVEEEQRYDAYSHIEGGSTRDYKHESKPLSSFVQDKLSDLKPEMCGILVRNLPGRSTDQNLKNALFHNFKQYGRIIATSLFWSDQDSNAREAVITFKRHEDALAAFEASANKFLLGQRVYCEMHKGLGPKDAGFQLMNSLDEFHHKASRVLFVGNLDVNVTERELRDTFCKFGKILSMLLKPQKGATQYAFLEYDNITSVKNAVDNMEGNYLGSYKLKLGYAKSRENRCLWLGGLPEGINQVGLKSVFGTFGNVTKVTIDSVKHRALVLFAEIEQSKRAVIGLKGVTNPTLGIKIMVDYASMLCQEAFFAGIPKASNNQEDHVAVDDKDTGKDVSESKRNNGTGNDKSESKTKMPSEMLGVKVLNLPQRLSDSSLKEALFHQYKKYGRLLSVQVRGYGDSRHAVLTFKNASDANMAHDESQNKQILGSKVTVEKMDVDDGEVEDIDVFVGKASRTLFIGNLTKTVTEDQLKEMFSEFGKILKVFIVAPQNVNEKLSYGFIEYDTIAATVNAIKQKDGTEVDGNKLKLGFGKCKQTTKVVYLEEISEHATKNYLTHFYAKHMQVVDADIDTKRGRALVYFETPDMAMRVVTKMKGAMVLGKKTTNDLASDALREDFYKELGIENPYPTERTKEKDTHEGYEHSDVDVQHERSRSRYRSESPLKEKKERDDSYDAHKYIKHHYDQEDVTEFDAGACRSVFMGNLDPLTSKDDIKRIFGDKYGPILSINIMSNQVGTYAFVEFEDIRKARDAINELHNTMIGARHLKMGYGKGSPSNVLWLGDLPEEACEDLLIEEFDPYGIVTRAVVDKKTNSGLVFFDDVEEAMYAAQTMSGGEILGQKVMIDFASVESQEAMFDRLVKSDQMTKEERDNFFEDTTKEGDQENSFESEQAPEELTEDITEFSPRATRSLYVGNMPFNMNKRTLYEMFSEKGHIMDVLLKRNFAFVEFASVKEAAATIKNLHNANIGQRRIRVNFASPHWKSNSTWVENIPEVVTEKDLEEKFSTFGKIVKLTLNSKKGQAIIIFKDEKSTQDARDDMHGKEMAGEKIIVTMAGQKVQDFFFKELEGDKSASKSESGASDLESHRPSHKESDIPDGAEVKGLLMWGFPSRASNMSIKNGLVFQYKKYGKITSVTVKMENDLRYAVVTFKHALDAEEALKDSKNQRFLGRKMFVEKHEGIDDPDYIPPEGKLDQYHTDACRTIYIGNLPVDFEEERLKEIFAPFGTILNIENKHVVRKARTKIIHKYYCFIEYTDILSAVKAIEAMDGEGIDDHKVNVSFGKSSTGVDPTSCIWIDNVAAAATEEDILEFCPIRPDVRNIAIDREGAQALVYYDSINTSQRAVGMMQGRTLMGQKVMVDFASQSLQDHVFDNMEKTKQITAVERKDLQTSNDKAVFIESDDEGDHEDADAQVMDDENEDIQYSDIGSFLYASVVVFPNNATKYHPKASNLLFIGNVTMKLEEELRSTFEKFGKIKSMVFVPNRRCFIEYSSVYQVVEAIKSYGGKTLPYHPMRMKLGFGVRFTSQDAPEEDKTKVIHSKQFRQIQNRFKNKFGYSSRQYNEAEYAHQEHERGGPRGGVHDRLGPPVDRDRYHGRRRTPSPFGYYDDGRNEYGRFSPKYAPVEDEFYPIRASAFERRAYRSPSPFMRYEERWDERDARYARDVPHRDDSYHRPAYDYDDHRHEWRDEPPIHRDAYYDERWVENRGRDRSPIHRERRFSRSPGRRERHVSPPPPRRDYDRRHDEYDRSYNESGRIVEMYDRDADIFASADPYERERSRKDSGKRKRGGSVDRRTRDSPDRKRRYEHGDNSHARRRDDSRERRGKSKERSHRDSDRGYSSRDSTSRRRERSRSSKKDTHSHKDKHGRSDKDRKSEKKAKDRYILDDDPWDIVQVPLGMTRKGLVETVETFAHILRKFIDTLNGKEPIKRRVDVDALSSSDLAVAKQVKELTGVANYEIIMNALDLLSVLPREVPYTLNLMTPEKVVALAKARGFKFGSFGNTIANFMSGCRKS